MQGTYSIIPIGAGLLFAYTLSYFAYRLKIISKSTQRKLWNTVLLISFLITASLGIFLALQVNYKFTLADVDKWMSYHVNFGISMAFVSVIHLSWHYGYYLLFFRKKGKKPDKPKQDTSHTYKKIDPLQTKPIFKDMLPVMALGITTMVTQIIVLREFMSVFQGNELILGLIMASWMLLTGTGAWLGKASLKLHNPIAFISTSILILGVLPLILIFLLHFLKNLVFIPGSLPGLTCIFISTFLLLLPFCFLSGYSFSFYSFYISKKYQSNQISRVYTWESLGSLAGGFVFSTFLVYIFKSMQILSIVLLLNALLVFFFLNYGNKNIFSNSFSFLLILLAIAIFLLPSDKYLKHFLYKNQDIVWLKDTPYGNLVVTKLGDQLNFYENNTLIFNTLNVISNEENVHYAMVQREHPMDILVLSGALSGLVPEILKYKVNAVDYVEINPWIIKAEKTFAPGSNEKGINIIIQDARRYLSKCKNKYDVVLINLPPPSSAQLNRYYSLEFFNELKSVLNPGGLISVSLPSSPNYSGKEEKDLHGLLYHTLKTVFTNVMIIQGEKDYFLASGEKLSLHIAALVKKRGIQNEYVSEYYLDDDLLKARSDIITDKLKQYDQLNTDFNPIAYFKLMGYRLSFNNRSARPLAIIILLAFIGVVFSLRTITAGMFAAGYSGIALEVLLLLSFQILYGYVYLMTAVIITIFMAGIALGAHPRVLPGRKKNLKEFIHLEFILGFLALAFPLLIWSLKTFRWPWFIEQLLFFSYSFVFAFIIGMIFSSGSRLQPGNTSVSAAKIYSADMLGGAFGAILISGFALPLLGLWGSSFVIASVCMLAAAYTSITGKNTRQNI